MGRACVDVVATEGQTVGSLSRYLHDVLALCGSGMWFEQLQQCMPPRSLEESLRTLLALGLIETVHRSEAPARPAAPRRRPASDVRGDFKEAYGLDLQQGSHGASLFNAVPVGARQPVLRMRAAVAPPQQQEQQPEPVAVTARRPIRSAGIHCWQLRRGA